jgi:hypothetical protein
MRWRGAYLGSAPFAPPMLLSHGPNLRLLTQRDCPAVRWEERLRALGVLPKINIRSQENAMHAIKALAVATILVFGFTSLAFARSGGGGGGSGASGGSAGGTSGGASSSSGPASGATGSVSTPGGNATTSGSGARNGPNNSLNRGDPNGPYKSYRPTNSLGVPSSPYGQ